MKRRRLDTHVCITLKEAFDYCERVKDTEGNRVEIELTELLGGYCVVVWQVR